MRIKPIFVYRIIENLDKIKLTGLGIVIAGAVGFYYLAPFIPILNSVMIALLVGIIIGNVVKVPKAIDPGLKYSGSKLLEVAIVLLAFGLSPKELASVGPEFLIKIMIGVVIVLTVAVSLSKLMKCPGSTGYLTAFGTAICGSSAIAAVAPVISKDKEDAGIAIAVVNLLGALGTFILPAAIAYIPLSEADKGFMIGGSLHAVGNVAGAGYAISDYIGETAISVKMIRVAMLTPMVLFYDWMVNRGTGGAKTGFKLPIYLWLFIGITALSFVVDYPKELVAIASVIGKIALSAAMFAIGLRLSLKTLYVSGKTAIIFGVVIFAVQILVFGGLMLI